MSVSTELPWVIVGYGRVGQSLALFAERIGATVTATWNRSLKAADAAAIPSPAPCVGELPEALTHALDEPCVLWLTVVDDKIATVFDCIEDHICDDSVVVHTSGSLPSTIIETGAQLSVASLHPLQAISDPATAVDRFARTFWTIEGDEQAVTYIETIVAPAGIEPIRIESEHKTLYHASAVTSANLLVSLFDAAISMAGVAEIDENTARQMLVELGRSSLENLAVQSPKNALTGPAARGDLEVIDRHRSALQACDDDSLLEIYDILTRRALDRLAE